MLIRKLKKIVSEPHKIFGEIFMILYSYLKGLRKFSKDIEHDSYIKSLRD